MSRTEASSEAWRKMVLRSMPPPAWLAVDAPDSDVAISSRVRYARNLRRYRYPHHATGEELRSIQREVRDALATSMPPMETLKRLTEAERDFLLGSRLISPDFAHREHGRVLMLDQDRMVSVMINEEDHIRLQALTAGWSLQTAQAAADRLLAQLESKLQFQWHESIGYLTASPANAGTAGRRSGLFHLIGLAHAKRLPSVLRALASRGLTARGLYGESSRAVGAFFQVSATTGSSAEFSGACDYLLREERQARREVTRLELADRVRQAHDFAVASPDLSLSDALRTLAWLRWGSAAGIEGAPDRFRDVDAWIATMEVHGTQDPKTAARHRAVFLRERLERRA